MRHARSCIRLTCGLWAAVALGVVCARAESTTPDRLHLGSHCDDFTLRDYQGVEYSLSSVAGGRLVVVVFLGIECPLAKYYASQLVDLAERFAPRGVVFLGIDSNQQDSPTEIAHFAREHGITFPLLKDVGNVVADSFGAQRTPEVFVLDGKRVLRYHGRVDDCAGVAYRRAAPTRNDLEQALDELLTGQAVRAPETPVEGCLIGRVRTPNPDSPVTWSKDILPIFQRRCQECHRPGEIGPFSLLSYADTLGWAEMIREVVVDRRMPPWHASHEFGEFANDPRLNDEEIELVERWVSEGAPEGITADAPPARHFYDGWQIAPPELVVYMSDTPFSVPATGQVAYQYFTVDPRFAEDRWIKAVECRPGNPAVVHHINVFLWTPELGDSVDREQLTNYLLAGYAPGYRIGRLPAGTARRIPAGTKFVFQMHYTSIGRAQADRSYMGLVFVKPGEFEHELEMALAVNNQFEIPPRSADVRVESMYELAGDAILYALIPHMHLRGKSFRYEALHLDGTREVLLEVPRYDFGWQHRYELARSKHLARGTIVRCLATYDNSADNWANPDPSATVRWGDQTTDEMMIGYLEIARIKSQSAAKPVTLAAAPTSDGSDRRVRMVAAAGMVVLSGLTIVGLWWWPKRTT